MISKLMRFLCTVAITFSAGISAAGDDFFPPAEYIRSKLQQKDIVFLGTRHKQPPILNFIAELIPSLNMLGVTHIGLEISSDQQDQIDAFMSTGDGLDDILLHPQIDCPEYRNLFQVIRKSGGPKPVAIDLPISLFNGNISRDEWMARSLLAVFQGNAAAMILVKVGNLHTLKKLRWEEHVPNKHRSLRECIQRKRPDTRMWSVGQAIGWYASGCDFTREFGPLPGAVALDLDEGYRGWRLGIVDSIAIEPVECFELVDGLIVY